MIRSQLESCLARLHNAHDAYRLEFKQMPAGKLMHIKAKDGERYYINVNGRRLGITRRPDLIRLYARKEYLRKALPILAKDIDVIERALKYYQPFDPEDVVASLSASFQGLPLDAFYRPVTDSVAFSLDVDERRRIDSHRIWAATAPKTSDYLMDGRTLRTSNNLRVRSKAELLIAQALDSYDIPYRYEQELFFDGWPHSLYPDFTFEGADGKEFYLEFCGMMDNPEYVTSHQHKNRLYDAAGIVPWKNLIYVYASGNDMDMMAIDNIIRYQIIPKL